MRNIRRATALSLALLTAVGGLTIGGAVASASATTPPVATNADLVAAVGSGQTPGAVVTLGTDLNLSASAALSIGQTLTLDLDGYTLNTNGISLATGVTLTIRDSDTDGDASTTGHLISDPNAQSNFVPGINVAGAHLVIKSGNLVAKGTFGAAGIGTGFNAVTGSVEIDGGTVTAGGGGQAPGIGGGGGAASVSVLVNGGTVTATTGGEAAGIGSSSNSSDGAAVVIDGGTVTAHGGTDGAGIGGGAFSSGGSVQINGGTVTADGQTGIGGGVGGDSGVIAITAGDVTATSTGSGAGIGTGGQVSSTGSIVISGGRIHATGNDEGAGIGGGYVGTPGTVAIEGGNVTATAGQYATAIGAGYGGSGGAITIGARAVVTATGSPGTPGRPVIGTTGTSGFGTLDVAGTLTIPTNDYLAMTPDGALTVETTGNIAGGGTLGGTGSVTNHGTISVPTVADILDPHSGGVGLTITDHNYLVTFDSNPPDITDTSQQQFVRIYAPTFAAANRAIAPWYDQQGFIFTGWNSAVDGSGNPITTSTVFSADQPYYAVWKPITAITVTPSSSTVVAGGTVTFALHGTDVDADSSNQTAAGSITDNTTDINADSSHQILFTTAGVHHISGQLFVGAPVDVWLATSVDATVTVTPAALNALTLTPEVTAATVATGTTQKYDLTGVDVYGNAIDGLPAHTTITVPAGDTTSTDPTTGVISVHFTGLGSQIVTATDGAITTTTTVTVVKDTPTIHLSLPSSWKHGVTTRVTLTLGVGASGIKPTGTVRVYYGTRYVTVTYKSTSKSTVSVAIPPLSRRTYSIYASYYGSTTYAKVSTVTTTIHAR
jgi:hypothetical protein